MNEQDQFVKIDSLKDLIQKEIDIRDSPQTIIDHLSNRALNDLYERLENIENILLIKKYDLAFIGQVGVGKTTAICHLFDLVMEAKKKKKIKKKEKELTVVEELMATGSGFTTLCEVVVIPDTSTFIEINPYQSEEVEKILEDFGLSIWLKAYPEMAKDQPDVGSLPPELVRAVRNMVDLPAKESKENDPAIKLARDFGKDAFSDFIAKLKENANISGRDMIKIAPDVEKILHKSWIKNIFSQLNLVKLPTFSIPHKIYIHIELSMISIDSNRIGSIIDTKGVDSGQFNREDLDRYIRDSDNTLCFLAESFLSAPSNVTDIIERHLTKESKDLSTKMILFVMPRENQPENVVGASGPVGERKEGIALRRNQIEEIFTGKGIEFVPSNIVMYDPLECYEPVGTDHQLGQFFDQEDIDTERIQVLCEIEQIIDYRERVLWKEVEEKENIFLEIQEGHGLDPQEEQLVRDAKPEINQYSQLDFVNADRFFEEYRRPWTDTRHVMTLRATNNRYGEYPPRDIDICYDARPVVEKLVRQVASRRKEKILVVIQSIKDQVSETSELQRLMPLLEERIDRAFEGFVRSAGRTMEKHLMTDVFYPQNENNPFWQEVQDRYGRGPGYREDVLAMYEDEIGDYENFLHATVEKLWQEMVIDKVLDFLG